MVSYLFVLDDLYYMYKRHAIRFRSQILSLYQIKGPSASGTHLSYLKIHVPTFNFSKVSTLQKKLIGKDHKIQVRVKSVMIHTMYIILLTSHLSTSTFRKTAAAAYSVLSLEKVGAIFLQGPHLCVQMNTIIMNIQISAAKTCSRRVFMTE